MVGDVIKNTHLRPLDPRKDLNDVADLIDICFDFRMDDDGREYVRQIRQVAQSQNSLFGMSQNLGSSGVPMQGFVWEVDGRLVGNLTLIPFFREARWNYLIANVATNPSFRRQGIARKLTQSALQFIRERSGHTAWLQVRDDNQAAYELYVSLGFHEITRRTTYRAQPRNYKSALTGDAISLTHRRSSDWPSQKTWLQRIYPPEIAWHLPFRIRNFEPGFWNSLMQFVNDEPVYHWAARRGDRLLGVASLETNRGNTDTLWLAMPENLEEDALFALLTRIRAESPSHRSVTVNFPSGVAERCFQSAGYEKHLTLIWMNQSMQQGQKRISTEKYA
jgi:ribosomal protein S18 acetylase RimI-like enzyme